MCYTFRLRTLDIKLIVKEHNRYRKDLANGIYGIHAANMNKLVSSVFFFFLIFLFLYIGIFIIMIPCCHVSVLLAVNYMKMFINSMCIYEESSFFGQNYVYFSG